MMTENAIKAAKRLKRLEEASDNHVEANYAGELISQDLYLVGTIKGVGLTALVPSALRGYA